MSTFATAINCIDGRVQSPVADHIKNKYGVDFVDMITVPGADKELCQHGDSAVQESIKKYTGISVNKHNSALIAVCGHHDCAGNPVDRDTHMAEIRDDVELVRSWGFGVKVIGLWINENWLAEEV